MNLRDLNPDETPSTLARDGYNISAQKYLDWTSVQPSPRLEWLEKLFTHFKNAGGRNISTTKILELGCGAGIPCTLKTAQTCGHVTGVEISSTQISLAKEKFESAGVALDKYEFKEADMTTVSFPDQSFDGISAFYSVIHLAVADQQAILERAYKWLVPGGLILFNVVGEVDSEHGKVVENWLGMNAYWAGFGKEKTLEILTTIGFEVLESERIHIEADAPFIWIIARKSAKQGP